MVRGLGLDFHDGELTSALISAVQQIAKGKMFSSAIVIVVMVDVVYPSVNKFVDHTRQQASRSLVRARARTLKIATLPKPDIR